jgi:hypothetical protein
MLDYLRQFAPLLWTMLGIVVVLPVLFLIADHSEEPAGSEGSGPRSTL